MTGPLFRPGLPMIPMTSNAVTGLLTLNGTTPVTVYTTAVDALSLVTLTLQVSLGTAGTVTRTMNPGAGFTVVSSSPTDQRTMLWLVVG